MGAWGNDGKSGNHYTAADLKDVYAAAMKNGLNLWDTAVVYGMGTSENILGELAKDTLPIIGVTKVHHVEDAAKAAWNDDGWTMEALKVHYKTLVRY